ncbi:MAG: class I adenylate-forming enzyme family protein, partial [Anaeromyxobacteraceae bacterium]
AALGARVRRLAGHLAAHGVGPGTRVLVALPNLPATVVASLAVQAVGGVAVEVNREWSAEIQAGILAQTGARHAMVWARDARTWGGVAGRARLERIWVVHPAPPPPPLLSHLGDTPSTLLLDDGTVDPEGAEPPPAPPVRLRPEDTALILYTSGSTGQPRGVVQTHRNLDANTRSIAEYLALGPEDRALVVLPLYYCYGRSVLQTHLHVGGSIFLDSRFAFPRVVMESLAAEGCTGFAGVPLTFEILRRQVDVGAMRFPRLRYVTQAGGAMAPDTIDWARQAFAPARLFVMYGQTEATARLSYLPPERAAEKRGSIGIPIPGVNLAVVDEEGRELPPDEIGHLVARGANVTPGYLDDPEATASILRDGWLWTGDLARRDADGFLFHEGRSKEILKIGGHRVSPAAIEQVVQRYPGVVDAAVVGEPDTLLGETPVAYVVTAPGQELVDADLRRHCRDHLPPYQVPIRFERVTALPRNESGKLLRADLAARKVHAP